MESQSMSENPNPPPGQGLPPQMVSRWEKALVGELLMGLYTLLDDAKNKNTKATSLSSDNQELLSRISNAVSQQNEALLYIAEFPRANAGIPAPMQVEMMADHAKEALTIE